MVKVQVTKSNLTQTILRFEFFELSVTVRSLCAAQVTSPLARTWTALLANVVKSGLVTGRWKMLTVFLSLAYAEAKSRQLLGILFNFPLLTVGFN